MVTLTFLDQQLAWKGALILEQSLSLLTKSRLLLSLAQATTLVTVLVLIVRLYFARTPRILSTSIPWLILLSCIALPAPLSMNAFPRIYPDAGPKTGAATTQGPHDSSSRRPWSGAEGTAPQPTTNLPWQWIAEGKYRLASTGDQDIVYVPRPYWLILSLTDSFWSGITTATADAMQKTLGDVPAHMTRISAAVNAKFTSPAIQDAVDEFLETCGVEYADTQNRSNLSETCKQRLQNVDTLAEKSLQDLGLTQNRALHGAGRLWAESSLRTQIELAHLRQEASAFDAFTGTDGVIDRVKGFTKIAAAQSTQYIVMGFLYGLGILVKTYVADAVGPYVFSLVNGVMNLVLALAFPLTMLLSFVPIIGWRAYLGFFGLAFVVRSLPYFYLVVTSFQGLSWKMMTAFLDRPDLTHDSGSIIVNALYSSGSSMDLGAFRGAMFEDLFVTQFALQFAQFALLYGLPVLACFVIFDILLAPSIAAIRSFHQTHKVASGASGVSGTVVSKGMGAGRAAYQKGLGAGRTTFQAVRTGISIARR
ncbi:MAG: hypothetical protein HYT87_12710 [Nitrospirae bacterium]|nr:hypothetical protein [Nitrospirota bacterium]